MRFPSPVFLVVCPSGSASVKHTASKGKQSTRDSAEEAAIRALVLRLWKKQQCGASWELEENCILWEIAGISDSDFYHTIFTLTLQHTLSRKRDSHSRYFPKGQVEKMKTLRFRVLPSSRCWLLLLTCPLEAPRSLLLPPAPRYLKLLWEEMLLSIICRIGRV